MKKTIGVAEDDPCLQEIFRLLLTRKGYEVVMIFEDNSIRDCRQVKADLFLLDIHLSGYSGLDICRQLKMQAETSEVPVIMISANPNIRTLAEKCGADDVMEKPFDSAQLLQLISFYLDRTTEISLFPSGKLLNHRYG